MTLKYCIEEKDFTSKSKSFILLQAYILHRDEFQVMDKTEGR